MSRKKVYLSIPRMDGSEEESDVDNNGGRKMSEIELSIDDSHDYVDSPVSLNNGADGGGSADALGGQDLFLLSRVFSKSNMSSRRGSYRSSTTSVDTIHLKGIAGDKDRSVRGTLLRWEGPVLI